MQLYFIFLETCDTVILTVLSLNMWYKEIKDRNFLIEQSLTLIEQRAVNTLIKQSAVIL